MPTETKDRTRSTFAQVAPAGNQAQRYAMLNGAFMDLEAKINLWVPPGREKALAITKLEEASMWANKGISRGDDTFGE